MRPLLLSVLLSIILSGVAVGNTGVFFGSGHSIQLVKSADVQMVSEDVLITPHCGASLMKNWANFDCTFVLKNLSSKAVKIQVGFPLDRERQGPPPAKTSDTEKVLSYHFIARDADETYHLRYVSDDPTDKLAHIFLWDISFAPMEAKTLRVSYILPMSLAMFTTNKNGLAFVAEHPERPAWHSRVEACGIVYCRYITETGKSWAAPIEKIKFRFLDREFEEDLRDLAQRPQFVYGHVDPERLSDANDGSAGEGPTDPLSMPPGIKLATVYRRIEPSGWKPIALSEPDAAQHNGSDRSDGIVLGFKDYKPEAPLEFAYFLISFPQTPADCDPWVRKILGKNRLKVDVLELRETAAAFFGMPPKTSSVRHFVEQQVWYDPKRSIDETKLDEAQRAILSRLAKIADELESSIAKPSPSAR